MEFYREQLTAKINGWNRLKELTRRTKENAPLSAGDVFSSETIILLGQAGCRLLCRAGGNQCWTIRKETVVV